MHCQICHAELPSGLAFCPWCGAQQDASPGNTLPRPISINYKRCGGCSRLMSACAVHCTGCGVPLAASDRPPSPPTSSDERRTVTVLQGDLVSFSKLVEALSPEEIKGLLDSVYAALTREVLAQGGVVDTFIGDAIVALFGVPHAHGDDPRRAVDAARGMHVALSGISRRLRRDRDLSLRMRIGIDTGPAVVGSVAGAQRTTVTGPVLAGAMELEAAAPPGGILVGAHTWHQLGPERQGLRHDEGLPGREAYLVTQQVPQRAEAAARAQDIPLVGRERELSQLAALYERAVADKQVVAVSLMGPSGIGKSRIVRELVGIITPPRGQKNQILSGTSTQLGRAGSVDLIVQWIRGMASQGSTEPLDSEQLLTAIAGILQAAPSSGLSDDNQIALLGHLAGLPTAPSPQLRELLSEPARLRRLTTQAAGAFFAAAAAHGPLVLIGDDHHHCRPSAAAFIEDALAAVRGAPILLLKLYRTNGGSELIPPTPSSSTLEQHELRLGPLSADATLTLIRSAVPESHLAASNVNALIDAADGNPRFALELARDAQEGSGHAAPVANTLHSLMQARLDRLPEEQRRLLRAASVVGLSFWDEILPRLGIPNPDPALEGLVASGLIRERRTSTVGGASEYVFSSDTVREVALANVLVKMRRFLHRVTASWLEERLGDRAYDFTEALAYHHHEGGDSVTAAQYLADAADRARALHASDDAQLLIQRALDLLPSSPEHGRALRLRAHLEKCLGELAMIRGDVDDAMGHFTLALSLFAGDDSPEATFPKAHIHLRIGEIHLHRSRPERALKGFADAHQQVSGQQGETAEGRVLLAEIAKARGWALSRLGRRDEAQRQFEAGLSHVTHDSPEERIISARLLSALGLLARFRGDPQRALDLHGQALKLARRTPSLELRCVCLVNWAAVLFDLRLFDQARTCYEEALEVQERIGRVEDAAISRINLAQVALEQKDRAQAIALTTQARSTLEPFGTHWALPELYRVLALIQIEEGETEKARSYAKMAISMGKQVEHHYYVGGAHRILGDLALTEGDREAAANHYALARASLEDIGEPRELAKAIVGQVRLAIEGDTITQAAALDQLKALTEQLRPYPQEPILAEIAELMSLMGGRHA